MNRVSNVHREDRRMLAALAASVAVHLLLLLPILSRVILGSSPFPEIEIPVVIPMEFELVSPPEHPRPTGRLSRYLSTVSSAASDVVEKDEKGPVPHGEGKLPFVDNPMRRTGAEGGGQSEIPPLPEPVADLGEAFERSHFTDRSSPQRELSLPEERPDFRNEGSARATIGEITINTTAWDFAPYLLELKHRIKRNWIPPLAFTALGAIHGYTWVRFRIQPDGRMTDLEVIEREGHESLHRASVNAVRGAAPFRPLPDDFPERYLEVTFGFYYLLPGDEDRFFPRRPGRE
jgi:TonB family protein